MSYLPAEILYMTAEIQDRMSAEIKRSTTLLDKLNVLIRGSMFTEDGVADLEECRGEMY